MHGLGNDFVVVDARAGGAAVTPALARALGDRNRGIGFDQLAVIRKGAGVAAEVDFWNADGTPADACGNATRCVARMLMAESGAAVLELRTGRGVLRAEDAGDGLTRVNMGPPELAWDAVPLAREMALDPLPLPGRAGRGRDGQPALRLRGARRRGGRPRRGGTALRARAAVPGADQRRVRRGDRPRDDPDAGLGARRHDHARLRLGGLRRGGRHGAARADRPAGHGAARRRRARRSTGATTGSG